MIIYIYIFVYLFIKQITNINIFNIYLTTSKRRNRDLERRNKKLNYK